MSPWVYPHKSRRQEYLISRKPRKDFWSARIQSSYLLTILQGLASLFLYAQWCYFADRLSSKVDGSNYNGTCKYMYDCMRCERCANAKFQAAPLRLPSKRLGRPLSSICPTLARQPRHILGNILCSMKKEKADEQASFGKSRDRKSRCRN